MIKERIRRFMRNLKAARIKNLRNKSSRESAMESVHFRSGQGSMAIDSMKKASNAKNKLRRIRSNSKK